MTELPSYLQLAATTSRSSASFAVVVSPETSKLLLSACQVSLSPQFFVPLWPPASVIMSTWMWKGETLEGNDTFFNFFQHQTARVHHQLLALSNSSWLYGCCACHHYKGYDLASFVFEEGRAIAEWLSCKHKRSVAHFQDNHLLLQFLELGCHMNFFPFTSGHGEKQQEIQLLMTPGVWFYSIQPRLQFLSPCQQRYETHETFSWP